MTKFKSLGLNDTLLQAITDMGFDTPVGSSRKNNSNPFRKRYRLSCVGANRNGKNCRIRVSHATEN